MCGIPRGRPDGDVHAHARHRLSRRVLLADLGRVTLGAVVLGPALAGCADAGTGADESDASSDGASASSEDPSASGGDTSASRDDPASSDDPSASDEGTSASGELTWERADFGFVSAYVLVRGGEAAIFDTGTGGPVRIGAALEALGLGWNALGHVILSHRHDDHAGGLSAVADEAPDAVLYGATPDLDAVRERVTTAQEVGDGDRVLGLRIVATPGHTEGHIAAIDEDTGVLLVGDAIVRDFGGGGASGDGIEVSPPAFTADEDQAAASVGVLADLEPTTILFGHGEPVTDEAATMLRSYADTLSG